MSIQMGPSANVNAVDSDKMWSSGLVVRSSSDAPEWPVGGSPVMAPFLVTHILTSGLGTF